jgi:hypothetical protein
MMSVVNFLFISIQTGLRPMMLMAIMHVIKLLDEKLLTQGQAEKHPVGCPTYNVQHGCKCCDFNPLYGWSASERVCLIAHYHLG